MHIAWFDFDVCSWQQHFWNHNMDKISTEIVALCQPIISMQKNYHSKKSMHFKCTFSTIALLVASRSLITQKHRNCSIEVFFKNFKKGASWLHLMTCRKLGSHSLLLSTSIFWWNCSFLTASQPLLSPWIVTEICPYICV